MTRSQAGAARSSKPIREDHMTVQSVRADQLSALLARAESAKGPDRELDGEVWCAARGYKFMNHTSQGEGFIYWHGTRQFRGEAERLTASLDATLALCERVLPGWDNDVMGIAQSLRGGPRAYAGVWRDGLRGETEIKADAPTRSLALLAAMLKALLAQAGAPS